MVAAPYRSAGLLALIAMGWAPVAFGAEGGICTDCLTVHVGPPMVVRGPFPDELDAPLTALKLPDGSFRAFSANGATYAIDTPSLRDLSGARREVMDAGKKGSINDCGRWLTSTYRTEGAVLGFVHQERDCDYARGKTDKSMALARSTDNGLTWTDLGTVITGQDAPKDGAITGEGDCTMVDGADGYLYGYCLRNSDWKTIVARAPVDQPTDWHKYFDGKWDAPGIGGEASSIGFVGIGTGRVQPEGWIAAVAVDPWFGGVRLSLSADKVTFVDLDDPLLTIDASDWNRPAATDLVAYPTLVNPETGGNVVDRHFLLSYTYVPPGKGFESRYQVLHDVRLTAGSDAIPGVQVGMALARWSSADGKTFVSSTGPVTQPGMVLDGVVADILTRAPEGANSVKLEECSKGMDQLLATDGSCETLGYKRDRTAGWLYAEAQPGTVPIYACSANATHLVSTSEDCEGLGQMDSLLGYGLTP